MSKPKIEEYIVLRNDGVKTIDYEKYAHALEDYIDYCQSLEDFDSEAF